MVPAGMCPCVRTCCRMTHGHLETWMTFPWEYSQIHVLFGRCPHLGFRYCRTHHKNDAERYLQATRAPVRVQRRRQHQRFHRRYSCTQQIAAHKLHMSMKLQRTTLRSLNPTSYRIGLVSCSTRCRPVDHFSIWLRTHACAPKGFILQSCGTTKTTWRVYASLSCEIKLVIVDAAVTSINKVIAQLFASQ